jgi:hypothetical protein
MESGYNPWTQEERSAKGQAGQALLFPGRMSVVLDIPGLEQRKVIVPFAFSRDWIAASLRGD